MPQTIIAVDVDRLNDDGSAAAITIRTNLGNATHIDFADGEAAITKMASVCMAAGLTCVEDTEDLVGKKLMTADQVRRWRADNLASLF